MKKKVKFVTSTIKETLPNGITLIVRENHSMPTISAAAYFVGGKCLENAANNGISALTQRLLIRGMENYTASELFEELENYGIKLKPFYGKDSVGLNLKTLSRHFDRAIDLFARVIQTATFPESEFEKEKNNQLEDIHKEKDDILSYCVQKCEHLVFNDHSYALAMKGEKESVESLTRDDVVDYYNRVYCPNRMVIAIVGDIKADYALEKMEQHFSSFNRCNDLPEIVDVIEPIKNVREGIETSQKQQVAICLGFQAPSASSEDFFTFSVLNQVLSGMGARLFVELRDKMGLGYTVNSRYNRFKNSGIFQAYILTGYKHKEKARMALLEEVDRLRTRLVSYDELVRAKRYHLGLFQIDLQSNLSVASKLAYYELIGVGYKFIDEYGGKIKLITRQKVKRAAEKFLKPQSYAIALLTPASYPKTLQ